MSTEGLARTSYQAASLVKQWQSRTGEINLLRAITARGMVVLDYTRRLVRTQDLQKLMVDISVLVESGTRGPTDRGEITREIGRVPKTWAYR